MSAPAAVTLSSADLRALLEWYEEAGVDAALVDAPVDRFAESPSPARRQQPAAAATQTEARRPAPPPRPTTANRPAGATPEARSPAGAGVLGDEAVLAARAAAGSAETLEELESLLAGFEGCALKRTARNLVFADGNPKARLMLVGEAPGRDEDVEGRPFVGRSGKLLDRMLAAIGLTRADVYIANVIYWRPPGNRDPSDLEVATCRPFIQRQIELVGPQVLVFLGNQASKALVGKEALVGIRRFRGRWRDFDVAGRPVPLLPTYHPAYLLRNSAEKRLAWQDFLEIKARLRSLG